jgi:hypothetical protein
MKTYKKEINGTQVEAYNDSNSEWCVKCNGRTERFDSRKWTMKNAMEFAVELFGDLPEAV